jgi:hypothetical protein
MRSPSLDLAGLVGPSVRVVAVDKSARFLEALVEIVPVDHLSWAQSADGEGRACSRSWLK